MISRAAFGARRKSASTRIGPSERLIGQVAQEFGISQRNPLAVSFAIDAADFIRVENAPTFPPFRQGPSAHRTEFRAIRSPNLIAGMEKIGRCVHARRNAPKRRFCKARNARRSLTKRG
jgi:hypothetical protein